jgi:superfamily II DNA or RNA helicase/diadenosine tetraphosphate (Ap4A) HIT family hydrolase
MDSRACPFCSLQFDRVAFSEPDGHGIWDAFPVNPGHLLIVPRRHAETWNDLTDSEKAWVWSSIDRAIAIIQSHHSPDGFNVGFNLGAVAGQTVTHFHLHVIPRFAGDVSDPRGGVRHVIADRGNYLSRSVEQADAQRLIKGGDIDPLLPHLIRHMDAAHICDIAVAFLLDSGARCLFEHLKDLLDRGGAARILVSEYLDVTEPVALRRLSDLDGNLYLKVYETTSTGFHLKSYAFLDGAGGVAFVGSSNLSEPALTKTLEWNYRVISGSDIQGFKEIRDGFDALFTDPAAKAVDADWIERYERRRTPPVPAVTGVPPELPEPVPDPHVIQRGALDALVQTRQNGYSAGLVILATGLGKTWLAAFDSHRPEFRRVLFVCHRDEILTQAVATFRRVRPDARIGRLSGVQREIQADFLFASVQTLARSNHLFNFQPDEFDYIVVDEFHHAAARSYQRVIDYFSPRFLLGLTATPDRTDGADLLTFCQENIVFEANIRDGIERGLLCPFRYFGVPDGIDYTNIPWRSSRFDEVALTNAVATEARARNALEQYRTRGGRRCLAFCCSQRHADFMTEFFVREGIKAVGVHSGPATAPRATSLERLRDGMLEVIFAVDMFNEGVDVPALDTVLMLRPTESTIIWLQQLGRGLRLSEDKDHLTVIDYIGNHRAFLTKVRGMAAILDKEAETTGRQREALEAIFSERLPLPLGCEVIYETEVVDILRSLLRRPRTEEALEYFYRDFEERNEVRPTAVETFHAGLNPGRNGDRSWLGFVQRMGGLNDREQATWSSKREFFTRLERTPTTKSYKIALLLAMFDGDALRLSLSIDDLARRVTATVRRIQGLVDDFALVDMDDNRAVQRLLTTNPIAAFVDGRGMGGVSYFSFDGHTFAFAFEVQDADAFAALLRETLDWRLAQYLSRGQDDLSRGQDVVCRVAHSGKRAILFLPTDRGGGGLPKGNLGIIVDGQPMVARVAEVAVNVVHAPDNSTNELTRILQRWFGDDAGRPGRGDMVRFRPTDDGIVMEPFFSSVKS